MADHIFPEPREASVKAEVDNLEATVADKLGERLNTEEFDVPTIPEWREMRVHTPREAEGQILPVAVIGRANDDAPARLEKVESGFKQICRPV